MAASKARKHVEKGGDKERESIIREFAADRWLAHRVLFGHRHQDAPAPAHKAMVEDFWSEERRTIILASRGFGKSTLCEEDVALAACERAAANILILGSSETRAVERLEAVKFELDNNEMLIWLYGEQHGKKWTEASIVTRAGVRIQARGRDQDLRGIKHYNQRPSLVIVDDFEDKDSVLTSEGRERSLHWFLTELLPACSPKAKVRVRATAMSEDSVPLQLQKKVHWPTRVVPICRLVSGLKWESNWPARFPMEWIEAERELYRRLGRADAFEREYMCNAVPERRTFQAKDIRIRPRERRLEAVYAFIDPARTVGRPEASATGWAVWSWIGRRLHVWECDEAQMFPDEIIAKAYALDRDYDLVLLGIEKTGLEEFLMQPLRHASLRKGKVIPLRALPAPRGKIDFIAGLQPFFSAGEVTMQEEMPRLRDQMLSFPSAHNDALNALAYAPTLESGEPVYSGIDDDQVIAESIVPNDVGAVLAMNYTPPTMAGALVVLNGREVTICADWIFEEEAAEAALRIVQGASIILGEQPRIFCPSRHFDHFSPSGLVEALRMVPANPKQGGEIGIGRQWLRHRMEERRKGSPSFRCAATARWTFRALAGGYRIRREKEGDRYLEAEPGPYQVLMEGIESLCAVFSRAALEEESEARNYAVDKWGRRFLSSLPAKNHRS